MELFSAKKTFEATDEFVPIAIKAVKAHFKDKGFTYKKRSESFISTSFEIQSGKIFKQMLGMKKGAVVIFTRHDGCTDVEIRDCIIKNQLAGPALLLNFVPSLRVPALITGAFGMGMQASLTEEVMDVIKDAYRKFSTHKTSFCPYCGAKMAAEEHTCSSCGRRLDTL